CRNGPLAIAIAIATVHTSSASPGKLSVVPIFAMETELDLDPEQQQMMEAGPNFVCVDSFAFGAATRYFQIPKEKCGIPLGQSAYKGEEHYLQDETGGELRNWDDALRKSTQEFQHRSYSLFTCNCHSFVANNLNRLGFLSNGWNVVNLAIFILLNGRWVSKTSMLRTILPFVVVFFLGVTLGGFTFLKFWSLFSSVLIGWFLLGTYCFKNLIQL
ncbi:hypothetical protein TSUD_224460, partial [Trifolium subterraneum]